MNFTTVITIGNIGKFLSFLAIAVLMQLAVQILLRKIIELFSEPQSEKTKLAPKSKRIYLIVAGVAGLINLGFLLHIIYVTIFTESKTIPPWFNVILKSYGKIILYAFLTYFAYKFGTRILSKMFSVLLQKTAATVEEKTRAELREKTLTLIISYLLLFVLTIFFIYESLTSIGIDLKALLATVGVASLAVGFGAQNLVKDFVNGFFIILEDQYAVGDVISANNAGGVVEKLTLRITQLRNTSGTLITIPNSEITMVQNMTKDWSRVDLTIGVDYSTDIRKALKIMQEELEGLKKEMPGDLLEPLGQNPDVLSLESFGDSSLNLRIWFKTKPMRQWDAQRKYNLRLLDRFNKEGITIPFPQQTISVREELHSQIRDLVK